jgi:DNA-binding transcriptional ArsR family regulator
MSWRATSWAAEQITGSPITKLVLLKLADNANDEGVCWPSVPLIADHTEFSIRTVQEHLHRLEAMGLVRIERRQAAGLNLANVYHLALAPPAIRRKASEKPGKGSGAAAAPVVRDQHQGGAGDAPGVVQLTASHIEEPPFEPSLNRPSLGPAGAGQTEIVELVGQDAEARWPEFRQAVAESWPDGFPADDEIAARRAFMRLAKINGCSLMIDCARLHGRELRKRKESRGTRHGPLMVKRPSNWLKEGDWQGYIPASQAQAAAEFQAASAAGRVKRGLGDVLFNMLRRKGLGDQAMAILDGAEYAGAGVFTITRPFQRTFLESKISSSALAAFCGGDHPRFQLVADARKVG